MRELSELKLLGLPTIQVEGPALAGVADTPEMRTLYEKNGTITTWYGYVETTSDPTTQEFLSRFQSRFNHLPNPDALLAYDLGHIIAASLSGCIQGPELDKQCFRTHMLTSHPGVAGPVPFDQTRNSLRPVLLMEIKNGKWVEYPMP